MSLQSLSVEEKTLSAREAADTLGMSIPTAKAMYRRGDLVGFLTPGGHLRISAESLESVRANGRRHTTDLSAPSSTLKARREQIDSLNLDAEEIQAKRQVRKLQSEDAEEEEQRNAKKQAEDLEREQRLEETRAGRLREERLQASAAADQKRAKLRQSVQLALV